jgi:integrase
MSLRLMMVTLRTIRGVHQHTRREACQAPLKPSRTGSAHRGGNLSPIARLACASAALLGRGNFTEAFLATSELGPGRHPANMGLGTTWGIRGKATKRIYDLRHTYATMSLAAGVSLFTLARRMGTSVEMIDRTYGHLALDAEDYERDLLDAYDARVREHEDIERTFEPR